MKTAHYFKILLTALGASLLITEAMAAVDDAVIKSWQAKPRFVQIQKEASSLLQQSRGASPAEKAKLEDRARALLKELRVMGYAPAKKLPVQNRPTQPASAKKGFGSMTPGARSTAMRTPGVMPPGTKAKIVQSSPGTKPNAANSRMLASSLPEGVDSKQLIPLPKATMPKAAMPKATMPLPAEFAYKKMPVQPAGQAKPAARTQKLAAGDGQPAIKTPTAPNGQRAMSSKSSTQVAKISPATQKSPRIIVNKGAIFKIILTGQSKRLYIGDRVWLNAEFNNTGGAANKSSDRYELRCVSNNCPFTTFRASRIDSAIKPGFRKVMPVIFNASKAGNFQLWVETKYGKSNKLSLVVKKKAVIRSVPRMQLK